MTTWTVGSSGRTYSTIAAAITAAQSHTFTDDLILDLYNDSEFLLGDAIAISGITVGSYKLIIQAAAGQSFADHGTKASNALRYNQSNGVGIRWASGGTLGAMVQLNNTKVEIKRLQFKMERDHDLVLMNNSGQSGIVLEGSIFHVDNAYAGSVLSLAGADYIVRNNVLIQNSTDTSSSTAGAYARAGTATYFNNTIVRTRSAGSTRGSTRYSATITTTNSAVFGFGANFNGTHSGSNNASDLAIGFGTSNQASLTYADQFEGVSTGSEDFRAKATGALVGNATASGAPTTDILGQTRASPPWIGAHEVVAGGGGPTGFRWPVMVMHRETPQEQARRLGFSGWRAATMLRRAA